MKYKANYSTKSGQLTNYILYLLTGVHHLVEVLHTTTETGF